MSIKELLLNGNEGGLDTKSLTPIQKITLRTVIVGLLFYGLAAL